MNKPKRTLEQALEIYKVANANMKYVDWLDSLIGTARESADRTDSLQLAERFGPVLGLNKDNFLATEILFLSFICTCVDVGTIIGRLMYEEALPEGLEETSKSYVN